MPYTAIHATGENSAMQLLLSSGSGRLSSRTEQAANRSLPHRRHAFCGSSSRAEALFLRPIIGTEDHDAVKDARKGHVHVNQRETLGVRGCRASSSEYRGGGK
jgi:hypothetical protein